MNFSSTHSSFPLHSFVGFRCMCVVCESPEVGVTLGDEDKKYVQPLKVTR